VETAHREGRGGKRLSGSFHRRAGDRMKKRRLENKGTVTRREYPGEKRGKNQRMGANRARSEKKGYQLT